MGFVLTVGKILATTPPNKTNLITFDAPHGLLYGQKLSKSDAEQLKFLWNFQVVKVMQNTGKCTFFAIKFPERSSEGKSDSHIRYHKTFLTNENQQRSDWNQQWYFLALQTLTFLENLRGFFCKVFTKPPAQETVKSHLLLHMITRNIDTFRSWTTDRNQLQCLHALKL